MNEELAEIIESLYYYCESMPEVEVDDSRDEVAGFHLENDSSAIFALMRIEEEKATLALRISEADSIRLMEENACFASSGMIEKDKAASGWNWVDITLDDSYPEEEIASLIAASYNILIEDPQRTKAQEDPVGFPLDTQKAELDRLIAYYKLPHLEKEIHNLAREAVLLKTRKAKESELKLGQTKIGGLPDLPESMQWPSHHSGKHLAFLAQINLAEVSEVTSLENLPESGILYFFSVYGWMIEDDMDPQLPNERSEESWTQVLYVEQPDETLSRRELPSDVNGFRSAAVEFVPLLSLPDGKEPVVTALNLEENDLERYDWDLVLSYRAVRNKPLSKASPHLLLGYAEYEQQFAEVVTEHNLQLLFQLATDFKANMCWGDGGLIYFWIRPEDLHKRDFSNIFVDCQGG